MKRAFVLTEDGHIVSTLVAEDTPDVFHIGDRIGIAWPIELGYGALIEAGEQGTVDYIDASTGFTEILMDNLHRGLHEWHNHIWLEPFGTEDILVGIVLLATITNSLVELVA
jgi:hypothetical protein